MYNTNKMIADLSEKGNSNASQKTIKLFITFLFILLFFNFFIKIII